MNNRASQEPSPTCDRFGPWLQEQCGAQLHEFPGRTECVVSIDHIETGCFAALFVVPALGGLKVCELCGSFPSTAAAWQALTDRSATVENISLNTSGG